VRGRLCLVGYVLLALLTRGDVARAGYTVRVSVNSAGEQGNGASGAHESLSADGRYVAFDSRTDDTSSYGDVFVRDLATGVVEQASVSSDGVQGNDHSAVSAISADGRCVAFRSLADNLVDGDTNGVEDVFVHDRMTGTTERVSISSSGEQADGAACGGMALSADGRYVVFCSTAANLVSGDTNASPDAFVHDRVTGTTERVSVNSAGGEARYGASSSGIRLSGDGRYVALTADYLDLGTGQFFGPGEAFVRDRLAGITELISVTVAGTIGDLRGGGAVSMSEDGRYIAFDSETTNLVMDDTNGYSDIFVRDRVTATTERLSVTSTGKQGDGHSSFPSISADGRYVVFRTQANNLVDGDTNGVEDVVLHDRVTGVAERLSVSSAGEQANGLSQPGLMANAISADGRVVVFDSLATNLVPGDTNDASDVFARVRWGFTDVFTSYWANDEIWACVEAGIVAGYPDGSYRPVAEVTRDQMAVYMARALAGGDAYVPTGAHEVTFVDVPADYWAFRYVEYCFDAAVAQGYADGYRPTEVVNRAQMAVYVARSIVDPTGEDGLASYTPPTTATFPDVATDFWAYRHIEYCKAQSVVNGYWDGTYGPANPVTRDQMAVYVARAFGLGT
jgi:hypothetical protein